MCVVGRRDGCGARLRPRWWFCPWARRMRWKLDSLARYTPSSASVGTMRAGGKAANRGSLATARIRVRSFSFNAWPGKARSASGRLSPTTSPPCAFQRCSVRTVIPAVWQAGCNRAPALWATSMFRTNVRRSSRSIMRPRPCPCGRSPRVFLTAPARRRSLPAPCLCAVARAPTP